MVVITLSEIIAFVLVGILILIGIVVGICHLLEEYQIKRNIKGEDNE